jgi:hypothetical protein
VKAFSNQPSALNLSNNQQKQLNRNGRNGRNGFGNSVFLFALFAALAVSKGLTDWLLLIGVTPS